MDIALFITAIGLLVGVTNIIVEVLKKILSNVVPTNILATIVAMVLTIGTSVSYCYMKEIPIEFYTVFAMIIAGFLVAYAAMFGFDKLKEAMNWKEMKDE